jgi:hypothetical protein
VGTHLTVWGVSRPKGGRKTRSSVPRISQNSKLQMHDVGRGEPMSGTLTQGAALVPDVSRRLGAGSSIGAYGGRSYARPCPSRSMGIGGDPSAPAAANDLRHARDKRDQGGSDHTDRGLPWLARLSSIGRPPPTTRPTRATKGRVRSMSRHCLVGHRSSVTHWHARTQAWP